MRLTGFGNEPIFRGPFIGRDGVRMFQKVAVHPGGEGRREVTNEIAWRVEELTSAVFFHRDSFAWPFDTPGL
jgi:hypothetical protein